MPVLVVYGDAEGFTRLYCGEGARDADPPGIDWCHGPVCIDMNEQTALAYDILDAPGRYRLLSTGLYRDGEAVSIREIGVRAQAERHGRDARARWDAYAALKGKTPAEVFDVMQSRMDAWTSLADARRDLREWLPLMAAAIAWLVVAE